MTAAISDSHRGRRLSSFAASGGLHVLLIILLVRLSNSAPIVTVTPAITPNFSVRFLNVHSPLVYQGKASGSEGSASEVSPRSAPRQAQSDSGHATSAASLEPAASQPTAKREYRQFQLPPTDRPQQAKQTLIQLDVPPQIQLKSEIPLPTVLLWTQAKLSPPARKQFVAPPANKRAAMQSLPTAVALEPPNAEIAISNVNVAAAILNNTPRLFHPPSVAPPVSTQREEPAIEIPQIGLVTSPQPNAADIISLPNTPARAASILGLPPANQIARHDVAGDGSYGGEGGAGHSSKGTGSGSTGPGGTGTAPAGAGGTDRGDKSSGAGNGKNTGGATGGASATTAGLASGAGSGVGARGAGSGRDGNGGTTSAGNGAGGPGANSGLDLPTRIPGVTRIDMPKDGKYSVVVLGSADSTRYPESVGALGGKILYTVYLRVGLRKNWIMQYCVARDPKGATPKKGATTALEAPWPFLMMLPDRWSASDPDYIMVHGFVTTEGRLDQLALVYPGDLEKKDLLLSSLKLWDFRPASRDGEPTEVEVLLIIPHEAE